MDRFYGSITTNRTGSGVLAELTDGICQPLLVRNFPTEADAVLWLRGLHVARAYIHGVETQLLLPAGA